MSRNRKKKVNRKYKDTVFRMLFKDKENLLGLYNAVSGGTYTNAEELEIVTLESAVYMGMKNDLAFLIDMDLNLFEHQSTINPNMPFRFLQYVSAEYEKLLVSENLYGEALIQIPTPHFVVFYNGTKPCEAYQELRLSNAFRKVEKNPQLELWVQVLNINEGFNEELKKQCRTLREYMLYVDKVRGYAKSMPIGEAVEKAVEECIAQDILREFLLKNKAEVRKMSIFEYDEEAVRRVLKKEAHESGYAEGKIEGKIEAILYLLEEIGTVPESLREKITAEKDEEILRKWLKLAATAESVEEFERCGDFLFPRVGVDG